MSPAFFDSCCRFAGSVAAGDNRRYPTGLYPDQLAEVSREAAVNVLSERGASPTGWGAGGDLTDELRHRLRREVRRLVRLEVRQLRQVPYSEQAATVDCNNLDAEEERESVRRAVAALPQPHRAVCFALLNGRTASQIADDHRVSVQTIYRTLARARELLAGLLRRPR